MIIAQADIFDGVASTITGLNARHSHCRAQFYFIYIKNIAAQLALKYSNMGNNNNNNSEFERVL